VSRSLRVTRQAKRRAVLQLGVGRRTIRTYSIKELRDSIGVARPLQK
jgi:hypothetical protein